MSELGLGHVKTNIKRAAFSHKDSAAVSPVSLPARPGKDYIDMDQ